jgi:hypothetical protein
MAIKKKKKVSPKFEKCGNKYLLNFFVLLERAKMAWTNGLANDKTNSIAGYTIRCEERKLTISLFFYQSKSDNFMENLKKAIFQKN